LLFKRGGGFQSQLLPKKAFHLQDSEDSEHELRISKYPIDDMKLILKDAFTRQLTSNQQPPKLLLAHFPAPPICSCKARRVPLGRGHVAFEC
jgi:hypothetical protein